MKIREVLNINGRDLEKDNGLLMANLIRPILAPIPPRKSDKWPATGGVRRHPYSCRFRRCFRS
jgi:hypothetical protein